MSNPLRFPSALRPWLLSFLLGAGLAIIVSACGGGPDRAARFEATANARRFPLVGVVRAVKKGDQSLTVAHEDVEGLMEGMTMDFAVRDPWVLDAAAAGDRIQATLVLDGARSWIESVAITKADSTSGGGQGAAVSDGVVAPGTALPDVALVDQDGRAVTPATYAGRLAVYTFIYTRCPLPDYCPLMMRRLNEIAARLQSLGRRDDVWLVAVTLDPAYDTPEVLKAFGDRMLEAPTATPRYARAALLTGEPEAIRALAATFQLTFEAEGNEIVHGLRTVVVDDAGRVVRVFRGQDWSAEDVVGSLDLR